MTHIHSGKSNLNWLIKNEALEKLASAGQRAANRGAWASGGNKLNGIFQIFVESRRISPSLSLSLHKRERYKDIFLDAVHDYFLGMKGIEPLEKSLSHGVPQVGEQVCVSKEVEDDEGLFLCLFPFFLPLSL